MQPTPPDTFTAEVVGPAPLSAAVIDLAGIDAAEVVGGDGFAQETAAGLRMVLVLYESGMPRLRLTADGSGSRSATIVELADADGHVLSDVGAYRVQIDG